VRLSTHYYVISLSLQSGSLFEAFRDTLIDIRNQGFPVNVPTPVPGHAGSQDRDGQLHEFLKIVDEHFGRYYEAEPLAVVVMGEQELQTAFTSVTTHGPAIVGRVEGDYTTTSPSDLGKIVWPVVKEAITGLRERALRDLETSADAQKICGLEAVGRRLGEAAGATLLVEESYHVRGSILELDGAAAVTSDVDVRDEIDDVVDMIIEKVLETGGNVIFVSSDSLSEMERIVLLLPEMHDAP
jgi:hypothetical protein